MQPEALIGYALGILSIIVSFVLHRRAQSKHKERLARLLDPHVVLQNLVLCRNRIVPAPRSFRKLLRSGTSATKGIHDLAVLHQTIRNVQKYVLVVRSESYEQYDTLLAQALDHLMNGNTEEGLKILDSAIILLAAEAKVLGE